MYCIVIITEVLYYITTKKLYRVTITKKKHCTGTIIEGLQPITIREVLHCVMITKSLYGVTITGVIITKVPHYVTIAKGVHSVTPTKGNQ